MGRRHRVEAGLWTEKERVPWVMNWEVGVEGWMMQNGKMEMANVARNGMEWAWTGEEVTRNGSKKGYGHAWWLFMHYFMVAS